MSGMTIECEVNTPNGVSSKIKKNNSVFEQLCRTLLDEVSEEVYMNIMDSGVGVAGGRTPSGGSPVYQGKKSYSQPPAGSLLRSHYIDKAERDTYHIKGGVWDTSGVNREDKFYIDDVINGNSKFGPNPYHERAVDKAKKDQIISKAWSKAMDKVLPDGFFR